MNSKGDDHRSPFFSFILGAYNCEQTVERSIRSLLDQSFQDFEIVVVNDGSTDSTERILEEISADDNRVRLIHQSNMGLTKSLNRAIDASRGIYLVRHDADDISAASRLEMLYRACVQGPDLIFSKAHVVRDGRPVKSIPSNRLVRTRAALWRSLKYGNVLVHGTLCMKRSCVDSDGYDERWRYAQDYELILRMVRNGANISFISENLYEFHMSDESISSKKRSEQDECASKAVRLHVGTDRYLITGKPSHFQIPLKLLRALEATIRPAWF